MSKSTRQRILEILETRPTATADELARLMHLTPANMRHHLGRLEADGRVIVVGERPLRGRGRPQRLFSLPKRGEGTDRLAGHLLDQVLAPLEPGQKAEFLRTLGTRLSGEPTSARHITQRLAAAVRRLNELEYQARWEAHALAPRVILGNCPYAAIIEGHPELCAMDVHLLENLLGEKATQLAKLEKTPQGLPACIFAVGKRAG
ncbi:MAG TPA: helix-turn-helix domain-containing protein [Anaerolineales bacterium]|nr:helix-turn-helix domain-containing protein [Anaerolineales bacterium]